MLIAGASNNRAKAAKKASTQALSHKGKIKLPGWLEGQYKGNVGNDIAGFLT